MRHSCRRWIECATAVGFAPSVLACSAIGHLVRAPHHDAKEDIAVGLLAPTGLVPGVGMALLSTITAPLYVATVALNRSRTRLTPGEQQWLLGDGLRFLAQLTDDELSSVFLPELRRRYGEPGAGTSSSSHTLATTLGLNRSSRTGSSGWPACRQRVDLAEYLGTGHHKNHGKRLYRAAFCVLRDMSQAGRDAQARLVAHLPLHVVKIVLRYYQSHGARIAALSQTDTHSDEDWEPCT